jgi:hypothetical protein
MKKEKQKDDMPSSTGNGVYPCPDARGNEKIPVGEKWPTFRAFQRILCAAAAGREQPHAPPSRREQPCRPRTKAAEPASSPAPPLSPRARPASASNPAGRRAASPRARQARHHRDPARRSLLVMDLTEVGLICARTRTPSHARQPRAPSRHLARVGRRRRAHRRAAEQRRPTSPCLRGWRTSRR